MKFRQKEVAPEKRALVEDSKSEALASGRISFLEYLGEKAEAIIIDHLQANVRENGIFVNADIFYLGTHELRPGMAAELNFRKKGQSQWSKVPMNLSVNDVWHASIGNLQGNVQDYEFFVSAWIDKVQAWIQFAMKKCSLPQPDVNDIFSEVKEGLKILKHAAAAKKPLSPVDASEIEHFILEFTHLQASAPHGNFSNEVLSLLKQLEARRIAERFPLKIHECYSQILEIGNDFRFKDDRLPWISYISPAEEADRSTSPKNPIKLSAEDNIEIKVGIRNLEPNQVFLKYRKKFKTGDDWKLVSMAPKDAANKDWHVFLRISDPGWYEYSIEARVPPASDGSIERLYQQAGVALPSFSNEHKQKRATGTLQSDLPGVSDSLSGGVIRFEDFRKPLELIVFPPRAFFGAQLVIFPRSWGGFKRLPEFFPLFKDLGYNAIRFMPIHPIGRTHRKGRNNSLVANPGDPGCPYAVGDEEGFFQKMRELAAKSGKRKLSDADLRKRFGDGGHRSIHPDLGTMEDFQALLKKARELGIEIILDIALNCSPDHPYVVHHPEWFHRRTDGTIRFAENPPKKYQDVYPINYFPEDPEDMRKLWFELRDMILFWIQAGVRGFRVDNPHTKPAGFWRWLFEEVHRHGYEDVIFESEAFTNPRPMKWLAKMGFACSDDYFLWRVSKDQLRDFLLHPEEGLMAPDMKWFFIGKNCPTTADNLLTPLRFAKPYEFERRLLLAATLSSLYEIFWGYEHCINIPHGETIEFENSEKYEIWNWPEMLKNGFKEPNIVESIKKLNRIRKENRAFQLYRSLEYLETYNLPEGDPYGSQNIFACLRATPKLENIILFAINLDSENREHWATVHLPLEKFKISENEEFMLDDLWNETHYIRKGASLNIGLGGSKPLAHIFRVKKASARTRPQQTTPSQEEINTAFKGIDFSQFDCLETNFLESAKNALNTFSEGHAAKAFEVLASQKRIRVPPKD